MGTSKKGVFTLLPSENPTQAPFLDTKCEQSVVFPDILFSASQIKGDFCCECREDYLKPFPVQCDFECGFMAI